MKLYGYTISKDPDSPCVVAAKDGQRTLYARTQADLAAAIREELAEEYWAMLPVLRGMLRDYYHTMETSDRPDALRIMKDIDKVLDKLQGRM